MKSFLLFWWGIWDFIYYSCNRMEYVSKESNLFRIVKKKYRGPSLQTSTGEWIRRGDKILKLHIHNYRLAKELQKYPPNKSLAIYLKRNIQESLEGLSQYVQKLPDRDEIKGVIGTSLLNRGAEKFGFATYEVDRTFYFIVKQFLYKVIYLMVHPSGMQHIRHHGSRLKSKHLVMSSYELINLYCCQENENEKNDHLHRNKGWRGALSSSKSN